MSLLSSVIVINGVVYTVDPKLPWVQAIVTSHDTIRYVGTTKKALEFKDY